MDVIFADEGGNSVTDFKGKLSYSWPRSITQTSLNVGDETYDPLFAFGFGLTYADDGNLPLLSEDAGAEILGVNLEKYLIAGRAVSPWDMTISDSEGRHTVDDLPANSPASLISLKTIDDGAQENTLLIEQAKAGESEFSLSGKPVLSLIHI